MNYPGERQTINAILNAYRSAIKIGYDHYRVGERLILIFKMCQKLSKNLVGNYEDYAGEIFTDLGWLDHVIAAYDNINYEKGLLYEGWDIADKIHHETYPGDVRDGFAEISYAIWYILYQCFHDQCPPKPSGWRLMQGHD